MKEPCECSMKSEFEHLKDDILEIKNTVKEDAKETTKEMMGMRDSKIRTEIALEAIIKTQDEANANQKAMLVLIQALKNEPFNIWKKMSWVWKTAVMVAIVNYIVTNAFGYVKLFN